MVQMDSSTKRAMLKIKEIIKAAYNPSECESCELKGGTCWECSEAALEDYRAAHPEQFRKGGELA